MAETVIPTIMDIAEASGYSGDAKPETVIEALLILADVVGDACAIKYKGTVSTYSNLPTTGLESGDMYMVQHSDQTHGIKAGDYVVWNGESWDVQGSGMFDISESFSVLSDSDIDALFA